MNGRLRAVQRACACGSRAQGECEQCKKKRVQRAADMTRREPEIARVAVAEEQSGQALAEPLRHRLEPLYGASFADVRVHDDAASHRTANELGARAFAVGQHLHFAAGEYRPADADGLHLLAHELAHTLQQRGTSSADAQQFANEADHVDAALEREAERAAEAVVDGRPAMVSTGAFIAGGRVLKGPDDRKKPSAPKKLGDPKVPTDVVLLMDDTLIAEALTLAPDAIILKVTSTAEMTRELGRVQAPFKSLFILSHSLSSGDLGFQDGGTTRYVRPEDVAAALKGTIPADRAPSTVDFRGCSVGTTPGAMDQIRVAAGAQAAIGGNCFMIQQANGPIKLRGKDILKRGDIQKGDEKSFQDGLTMLRKSFGAAEACIIDPSEDAYFRAKGKMVALWVNDSFSAAWDDRASRCYSALTREKVPASEAARKSFEPMVSADCKLIRVEGPAAAVGSGTSTKPKENR